MKVVLAVLAAISAAATAIGSQVPSALPSPACPQFFLAGQPPASAAPSQVALCFHAYGLSESTAWREPVWSGEHLQGVNVPPKGTPRINLFHVEQRLAADDRSDLADYRTPWDRGHATPVGDFTDPIEREESFSLANMMPQAKVNNEETWNNIENGVRAAAKRWGEVWVVTGPHVPPTAPLLNGRVAIPDAIWKAIYIPATGAAGAYWSPNDASRTFTTVTLGELTKRTGVDPFPALAPSVKAQVWGLPLPVGGE